MRRCSLSAQHRTELHGIRIASPEWTLIELAEHLALVDLVVVMDCALARNEVSLASLRKALVAHRPGIVRLRQAIELADGRSESPLESVLRLIHAVAGFTDVQPQYEVYSPAGEFIARLDLRLSPTKRAAEADGGQHRDQRRHQHDLHRDKGLSRYGWQRYGYSAQEIYNGYRQIILDAESAYAVAHDPERERAWGELYRASSLHPQGRRELDHRVQQYVRTVSRRTAVRAGGKA